MNVLGRFFSGTGRKIFRPAVASVVMLVGWGPVSAVAEDTKPPMRRIDFQIERTREVANDRVTAVLRITHDDINPASLADRINTDMAWALERAKKARDVEVKTGQYNTAPIRDKQRITGWTGSQDLILTSAEVARVTQLVGGLQERLHMTSLQFSVSDERRREVENKLIEETIEAFRKRADLIRSALGATEYELVQLGLNTGGPTPIMRAQFAEARSMSGPIAPPAVEGGTSTLRVGAHATIELR